jgi:hypothetical protein
LQDNGQETEKDDMAECPESLSQTVILALSFTSHRTSAHVYMLNEATMYDL